MFGESNLGDAGHQGQSKAAAMADGDEVCGCNGVNKGTICKAIKEKGLFTLDDVRKHTKASASCGSCTGPGGTDHHVHRRRRLLLAPKKKAMCGCTDHSHQEVRDAIKANKLITIADTDEVHGVAHAQRLRLLPARR
jgi:nitrite reductase (NADH) large subunit